MNAWGRRSLAPHLGFVGKRILRKKWWFPQLTWQSPPWSNFWVLWFEGNPVGWGKACKGYFFECSGRHWELLGDPLFSAGRDKMSASFLSSPKIPHSVSTSVPWDQWWGCHWGSSAFREVAPQWVLEVVLYRLTSPGAPEQERNKAQLHRMVAAHKKHIWMIPKKKKKQNKIQKYIWDKNVCCFSAQGILLSWFFVHVVLFAWIVLFPSLFLSNSCLSLRHGQVVPIVTTTLPLATIPVCLSLPDLYENYLLMGHPETMNFFCLGIVSISFVVCMSGF